MTFDLKAAREICIKLGLKYPARSLIDQEYQCSLAAEMLPAALDEIEQQNAYIEQLSKQCQAFIHDEEIHGWIQDHHDLEMIVPCKLLDVAKKWHAAYRKAQNSNLVRKRLCEQKDEYISEQAKRIAELEDTNEQLRVDRIKYRLKQRAALKKLGKEKRERGKALVEERAKRLVADRGDCPHRSPIKNQLISRCDKGIICDWCQCPIKDEWRDEARRQLAAEHPDLFGPEDITAKPAKIVLTEEQRAALELVCDLADEYECKYASTADEQSKAIDIVRALLQEART